MESWVGFGWRAYTDDNEDFGGGDMVVAVLGTPHGHQSATQQYHERHRTQHPAKLSAICFFFLFAFSSCCSRSPIHDNVEEII